VGDGTLFAVFKHPVLTFQQFNFSFNLTTDITSNWYIKVWKEIQLNFNQTVTPKYLQKLCEKAKH
jgi:hypothetical protein